MARQKTIKPSVSRAGSTPRRVTYPSPNWYYEEMKYPNNDLWSVRQIEFLRDALDGYEGKTVIYYPEKEVTLDIPDIATYKYIGVLHFPGQDRTIILEQGDGFGLKQDDILGYLREKGIKVEML